MSSGKRVYSRSTQRGSKSGKPPASRRGREHWTVRWIGAAKRRSKKPTEVAESPGGLVIRLTCVDTFLRPVRPGLVSMIAQVLPFRGGVA